MIYNLLKSLLEMDNSNQLDILEKEHRITYHVSPVKFDPNDKWGSGYDELYDVVNNYDEDDNKWEILKRTLKAYEKSMGNISSKKPHQIYVSSQPEAWIDVQVDELNITYEYGGIYIIITKNPVEESNVPAGMGYVLPEAIIDTKDIVKYFGPFKNQAEAFNYLKSNLNT